MGDILDGLKSRGQINTAAAETVELRTGRKDIRMVLERTLNSLRESTLKSKSAADLLVALELVGLASGIIAASTTAVISRATTLSALGIAITGLVASLADTSGKELVAGHGEGRDLSDHAINAETDLTLSLESTEVLLGGVKVVVKLGKLVGDEVLRDSSRITSDVHDTMGNTANLDVLHESVPGLLLKVEVTVLARDGGGLSLGVVVGILEDGAEVDVLTVGVDGGDPAMRPAGGDISVELRILKASIGGSISRSRGGNVHVVRELLVVEHGARVASRHEEDKLLEHLLLLHGIQAGGEIVVVEELISGHGDDARATVVIVEDENVVVGSGSEGLARASSGGVARENVDEVLNAGVLGDVILHDALINVDVLAALLIEVVEDLTRERILSVESDIILEEGDDVLIRDTHVMGKLVSLAHGRLVTIVAPASATSDQNDPGVATLGLACLEGLGEEIVLLIGESDRTKSKCNKDSLHHSINNNNKTKKKE